MDFKNDNRAILVTGGAGFVGSHLVERLLNDGHSVVVLDNLSTGSLANLKGFQGNPRLKCIESSVSDCPNLNEWVAEVKYIFHLAAAVGVNLVVESPTRTIHTNLHETEVILDRAAALGVPVMITSTSEVYGKRNDVEFREEDDLIIGPPNLGRWSYACSKLMDEFLAMAYAGEKGLNVHIVRLFNTVGPRQTGRYGMVLPRFIRSALLNEPLEVYGSGKQTRCFCYVKDTVEALVRIAQVDAARSEVINVGSTDEISIRELAERVIELTGSQSTVKYVDYARAYGPGFEDMQRRRPSIEKLAKLTGFAPSTRLDEIILSTTSWMREVPESSL